MARKLNKSAADKTQVSAQSHDEQQRDLLDPVTAGAVGAFGWFAFKAALQGIIGWIAVQLFIPVWTWWRKDSKEENEPNPEVPATEQESES